MAEDNELEKRAVEELLRETDRARVRAETMGPAGWLKCPLRSTNKRFLLNTLRSTGLQRRTDEPTTAKLSTTRGHTRSESPDRRRDRSRTPPKNPRNKLDHKHLQKGRRASRDKKLDRDKDRRYRHRDDRDKTRADGRNRDKDGPVQNS